MRITRACEYAVRCMVYMALNAGELVVPRTEIARAMDVPGPFLSKVAQQLAKAGFIEIVQGSKGGYRLLKSPAEVSLLDVVEAIEGTIFLNDCIMRPDSCFRSTGCSVHRVWQKAREELRTTLGRATLKQLVEEESCVPGLAPGKANG